MSTITKKAAGLALTGLLSLASGGVGADEAKTIQIGGERFDSLQAAFRAAEVGDTIYLGPGEYRQAGVLRQNSVRLRGSEGTVLREATVQGKGAIVVDADEIVIEGIECHGISVSDNNGACVRLQGENLTLRNVYFHDSEQGLLAGSDYGRVVVESSRFERLGKGGRAHGIYVGSGGELIIRDSHFIASKGQGHEVKSRAAVTRVMRSVIDSRQGQDSRLLDVPNGGVLRLERNVLRQGPNSSNRDAIGYGLGGIRYDSNRISLLENIILMEREGTNKVLHIQGDPDLRLAENLVVSSSTPQWPGINFFFRSREEAGLPPAPELPAVPSSP